MNEFALIEKYFAPLSLDGLSNDGAVLSVPAKHELVITSDTLTESTHFPAEENPQLIAHKALRANLSDLAAMGADPYAYQLNLALAEDVDEAWIEAFAKGLKRDQDTYKIFLLGGDTTGTKGPTSVSITALGLVPEGRAVTRSGARAGDAVVLSGPVGDAWMGLEVLLGHLNIDQQEKALERYRLPQPCTAMIPAVREYARAAIDISDGLMADLSHICRASHVSARLELEKIPFSNTAQKALAAGQVTPQQLLSGGDDYELLLAIAPEAVPAFLERAGSKVALVGYFGKGSEVTLVDKTGTALAFEKHGWQHFQG